MTEDLAKVAADSVRGTFFLAMGNTISTLISAFSVFIVARILGAELYGVYTISLTVPSLLLLFIDFGINQALIRFSASLQIKNNKGKIAKILRQGLFFKIVISIVIFSVALIFADHFAMYIINRPNYGIYIRLGSLAIIFQILFNTIGAIFVGLDHPGYRASTSIIQALAKSLLSSLFVLLGFGVIGVLTGYVLSYIIAALISIVLFLTKLYKPLRSSKDEDNSLGPLKTMLIYGFPLYLSALISGLSSHMISVILAIFVSDISIGNYKASINFLTLFSSLTSAVILSLLPAFSKLNQDKDKVKIFFTLAHKYTALLIIPITTIFIIFSKELVQVIYGETYQSASFFLTLSVLPFFLVGLGGFVLKGFFNGIGETKVSFLVTLFHFIVFICLAPLLTKSYNVPGLIIAILFASSAATILEAYIAKTRYQVQPEYQKIACIYLVAFTSALPALLTVYFVPLPTLPKILLSGVMYIFMYFTLIPITRIIVKPELESMMQNINNMKVLKNLTKPFFTYMYKLITKMER